MRYNYRPIDTKFGGRNYRSRLEARWAVFFQEMGYHFEYEPEGMDIDGTWYLPDFRLMLRLDDSSREYPVWAEVKPNGFDQYERHKCFLLSAARNETVFMLDGFPDFRAYEVYQTWNAPAGESCIMPCLLPCLQTDMKVIWGTYSNEHESLRLSEDYVGAVESALSERFTRKSA